MSDWTFLTKFIIVGDQAVGKSAILIRLTEQRFLHNTEATIGVEFGTHLLTLDNGDKIKIQVWDTAGSEAFRSITRSYYRGAAGALLVFSLVHRASFLHLQDWLSDVREHAEESASIVLVGNMADLAEEGPVDASAAGAGEPGGGDTEAEPAPSATAEGSQAQSGTSRRRPERQTRQVTREEAEAFAKKEGLIYVETSAKTGQNVEEAFSRAAREVHRKFLAAQQQSSTADTGATGGGVGESSGGPGGFLRTRVAARRSGGGAGGGSGIGSAIHLGASGSAGGDEQKSGCCSIQ